MTIVAPGRYGPDYVGKQSISVKNVVGLYEESNNYTLTVDNEKIEPASVKTYDILTNFNVSTATELHYVWLPIYGSSWDFHNIAQITLTDTESNYTKEFNDGPWTLRPYEIGTYCPDGSVSRDDIRCVKSAM